MTIVIPTWLFWIGGILGGVAIIWLLAWIALFAILGKSFYTAFKGYRAF